MAARLVFETGVVVMLQLRSQIQQKLARDQAEFLFSERAINAVSLVQRIKGVSRDGLGHSAWAQSNAKAVGELLETIGTQTMQKIDVKCVAVLAEVRADAVIV